MTTVQEDANWICTAEIQNDLLQLHTTDRKKWRKDMTKMIREHPSKFSILTVGLVDDGDNLYTFDEFKAHFTGTIDNDKLLQLMYDDIEHHDKTHIKYLAIHRWINEVKKQKQSEIVKDHKWLFTKMLHVQAAHLDADGSGEIDRTEFVNYFVKKVGFPEDIANAMFDDIDINDDGDLSVMEYTKWKNKHNKPHKLSKFLAKVEEKKKQKKKRAKAKANEDADDMKCAQCRELKLKYESVNSKHTNLLQDYKQLSQILEKGNHGNGGTNNANDAVTQQRISSLQRENKRLTDNMEDLENENKSKKDTIRDIKEKLSQNTMNLRLKDEEIERLNALLQDVSPSNVDNSDKIAVYLRENEELNNKFDAQNTKMRQVQKEMNRIGEENDEHKIDIATKKKEIDLLKSRVALYTEQSSNAYDEQMQQVRTEKNELQSLMEKQRKEMKRLRGEMNEMQANVDSLQKEKREIKSALSEKEGEITILSHKLDLAQQQLDDPLVKTSDVVDNERYKKLQADVEELEEQNMKYEVNVKHLKAQIHDLDTDLHEKKERIQSMQVEVDKATAVTQNAQKVQNNQLNKMEEQEKEIEGLKSEKSRMKQEIFELNALLEKHQIEKSKIATEKEELHDKIEKERHNQVALVQQFDELESAKAKDVKKIESELVSLREKYKAMENTLEATERKTKEELASCEEKIGALQTENVNLQKKVQTEKNHLDAVLREYEQMEEKQRDLEKAKVSKAAVDDKHDLSKLELQIEILNSDVFRMRSLLLLNKHEKLKRNKYYGFLDFAKKDLSNKALKNVFAKLKVTETISAPKLGPLLAVIVKLYVMRLSKLKSGNVQQNNDNMDRRITEHLGVWIIRTHSMRSDQTKQVSVLNDENQCVVGAYAVFDGNISVKELITLFASWCQEYVDCNGRHDDSKLT